MPLEMAGGHELSRLIRFRKCLNLRGCTILNRSFAKGPGVTAGDSIRKIMDKIIAENLACKDPAEREEYIHCPSTESAFTNIEELYQDVMF